VVSTSTVPCPQRGVKSSSPPCPHCGEPVQIEITDSRRMSDVVRRRKNCLACSRDFTTYEISAESMDHLRAWEPRALKAEELMAKIAVYARRGVRTAKGGGGQSTEDVKGDSQ
jgi:hypothetical protein